MQHVAADPAGQGQSQRAEHDASTPAEPPCAGSLSPRQRETLTLIASGATDKQIGRLLRISAFTVGHHLARARERLGATTTAHAVAIALRLGLIDF
jgi:DNA-binding CsgD family transcriptional regulator